MKFIIFILILLLFLFSCVNSYQSCKNDCVRICNNKKCDEGHCTGLSESFNTYQNCKTECYHVCSGEKE